MHPLANLRVVLVSTRNSLNLGAVARAMSNFGASHLRVVTPYEPSFRQAVSAVGAGHVMQSAEEFPSVAAAIADCSLAIGTTAIGHRELLHPLRSLPEAAPLIRGELASSRVALLFGSEKFGLSKEALSHCHWLLHIPAREEHRSMNLGQAAAVCLYELSLQGRELPAVTETPASSEPLVPHATLESIDRLTGSLLDALRVSGYVAPRSDATAEEKLRRMIRRFRLQAPDAEVLLGMLKKILHKLQHPGSN